ncbi:MAG TPA: type II toxin-antitoxin system death-on-curing family toxin [Propylenella sp.]
MGKRHYRLTLADALSAHETALTFGSGLPGVANLGLVESAIARPYNGYHRSIERKAAALIESMARNHGFADGNKRTTIILMHMLLTRSGYRLVPASRGESVEDAAETMVLSVVTRNTSFQDIVAWFQARVQRV